MFASRNVRNVCDKLWREVMERQKTERGKVVRKMRGDPLVPL